jgi:hypothetical protein
MDRERGRITLIPNIHITGSGQDFVLLLPMPSVPEAASVPDTIWQEAFDLTAATGASTPDNLGCSHPSYIVAAGEPPDDSVTIVQQTHVGAFILTTLQAEDPDALVTWLNQNGFKLALADAEKFRPFIQRGWAFCVMRLDPSAIQLDRHWDVSVDPVAFTFQATQLEVPLSLLSINRDQYLSMFFFIVDQHRPQLSGFQTTYANRISKNESIAIKKRYPELAAYLSAGTFLTRLDRTFTPTTAMSGSIVLTQAPDDSEFQRAFPFRMSGESLVFGFTALLASSRVRRQFRRGTQKLRRVIPILPYRITK